jgi:DNA-binding LacI/PurR family transcriptional regulator
MVSTADGRRKPVGIRDVAAAAGVSPATVSQAYNDKGAVAEATRARVLRVGEQLGYRPNAIGQALRSGRSRVIGVVVSYRDSAIWDQTYMPYYRSIIAGAAIEAVDHGYAISAAASLRDGRIDTPVPLDGVIIVDPVRSDPVVEFCVEQGMCVVTDGGYARRTGMRLSTIRADLRPAIPALMDHVRAHTRPGPLRPALVVGPRLDSYSSDTIRYFRSWCRRAGITPSVTRLTAGEDPAQAARALLSSSVPVNAVHCLNETYCHAVLSAADSLGIDVPGSLHVSVLGSASAVGALSRVTYLDLDPVRSGALCARTLIELVEGDAPRDLVEAMTLVPAAVPRLSASGPP